MNIVMCILWAHMGLIILQKTLKIVIHYFVMSTPRPLTCDEQALLNRMGINDPAFIVDPVEFLSWYDETQSKIDLEKISPRDFCMLEVIFDRRPFEYL